MFYDDFAIFPYAYEFLSLDVGEIVVRNNKI